MNLVFLSFVERNEFALESKLREDVLFINLRK